MTTSVAPWRARSRDGPSRAGAAPQALGDRRVVDRDHPALAGGDDLARVQREAGQRPERADRPPAVRRADRAGGVLDHRSARGRRRASRNASMSAGSPTWWTGMIAFVRGVIARSAVGRVEVVGARVDVGEDRRRAALPDRVGGGDERQRRDDHLVARARRPTRRGRGAARSCSWSSRPRRARRRARRRPPRTPRRAGPAVTQPRGDHLGDGLALVAAAATACANGTSIRRASASAGERPGRRAGALGPPPLDQARQALLEVDLGLEAERLARRGACRRGAG